MLPGVDFNAIKLATVSFATKLSPIGMAAVAAGTIVAAVALRALGKDLSAVIPSIKGFKFSKPSLAGVVQSLKSSSAQIAKTALNVSTVVAGLFLAVSFARK